MSTDAAEHSSAAATDAPVAAIDVGGSGIRMLVARVRAGRVVPVAAGSAAGVLGAGLRPGGTIPPEALELAHATVSRMAAEARALGARRVVVACTAHARRARNADELLAALGRASGVRPRALSGAEEAEIAFRALLAAGARDPLIAVDAESDAVAIMGGERGRLRWSASIPTGLRAVTARFSPPDPPAVDLVEPMVAAARELVDPLAADHGAGGAVAVGDVAADLAAMAGSERLGRDALVRAVDRLVGAPAADVAEETGVEPGRVRLCLAGAAILEAVRRAFALDALEVGQRALREGLVAEAAE